jgi:hypothetical protein
MDKLIYYLDPLVIQFNICLIILLNLLYHKMKINKDLVDFHLQIDHEYWQFKQDFSKINLF